MSHRGVSKNNIKNINKESEKRHPKVSDEEIYKELENNNINDFDESDKTKTENFFSYNEKSDNQVDINNLNNRYFLTNYKLLCSFDSFLSIFINAIFPSIL